MSARGRENEGVPFSPVNSDRVVNPKRCLRFENREHRPIDVRVVELYKVPHDGLRAVVLIRTMPDRICLSLPGSGMGA
jgi:hypothetical protein